MNACNVLMAVVSADKAFSGFKILLPSIDHSTQVILLPPLIHLSQIYKTGDGKF